MGEGKQWPCVPGWRQLAWRKSEKSGQEQGKSIMICNKVYDQLGRRSEGGMADGMGLVVHVRRSFMSAQCV